MPYEAMARVEDGRFRSDSLYGELAWRPAAGALVGACGSTTGVRDNGAPRVPRHDQRREPDRGRAA